MSEPVDEQALAALQRATAIAKAVSLLGQAGDALSQAATGDEDYERALRQAEVAHYGAKIAALRMEVEALAAPWESVPGLEKKARALGLLR